MIKDIVLSKDEMRFAASLNKINAIDLAIFMHMAVMQIRKYRAARGECSWYKKQEATELVAQR